MVFRSKNWKPLFNVSHFANLWSDKEISSTFKIDVTKPLYFLWFFTLSRVKLSQFQNSMFVLIWFMKFEKLFIIINHHKINGFKTEATLNFSKIVSNQGHVKNSISRDQAENISISWLLAESFNNVKNGLSFITS